MVTITKRKTDGWNAKHAAKRSFVKKYKTNREAWVTRRGKIKVRKESSVPNALTSSKSANLEYSQNEN